MIISEILTKLQGDDAEAITALYAQLSQNSHPDSASIEAVMGDAASTLLVLRDDSMIVGMGTLVSFHTITDVKARLEDIVVDGGYRGQGLGERISSELIEIARQKGASSVELTSKPEREAANALYQKLGFQKRETNTYLLKL